MRFRCRFAAAGYLGLAVAIACSPVKTAAPPPGVEPTLRPFLLDPTVDCAPQLDEATASELQRSYRELIRSGDAAVALRVAEQAVDPDSTMLAAQVLRAEVLLVAARPREAVERLQPLASAAAECVPLALALGRAQEEVGDLPEAFVAYRAGAWRSETAAERARAISARALEVVRNRFSIALLAGRREAAAWHLSRMERFWPVSTAALESAMEMAQAAGDTRGELAAVKALLASRPKDSDLALRRGQLELAVGDPRSGLALIEALAAAKPGDPLLRTELARAKFSWRLLNAPEQVRGLRDKVVLSRGDFAVLLYWMVPQIRTARPGAAQIASDIVDHPSREEIARVANLGLMTIDETMHRFSPDAGLRRSEAVASLVRLISGSVPAGACEVQRSASRDELCKAGVDCGLIEDLVLCQAGAGVSGGEAVEMLRRALERLGDA